MTGSQRSGVFLSYARTDGEDFAAALRERLRTQAADIVIKQDRILLEGGVGWWKQLTEAIDSVEFLVLVMTPSAMQSETVRKEWRYARQQGVCVYPVKAAPDSELKFSELPRWMRKAHFFDTDKEWQSLIAPPRKSALEVGVSHKGCSAVTLITSFCSAHVTLYFRSLGPSLCVVVAA